MKLTISLAVAGLSLLAPSIAMAQAAPAELIVQGTITPNACMATVTGGGAVDLGIIATESLNATANTPLPSKDVPFTITCAGPTNFAFSVIDNKAGSAVDAPESSIFGLGLNLGTEKIGRTFVDVNNVVVDSNPGQVLTSDDAGATWVVPANQRLYMTQDIGFAETAAGVVRGPVTTVAGTLSIVPEIAPSDTLTTSADIAIDGSITMEMLYR